MSPWVSKATITIVWVTRSHWLDAGRGHCPEQRSILVSPRARTWLPSPGHQRSQQHARVNKHHYYDNNPMHILDNMLLYFHAWLFCLFCFLVLGFSLVFYFVIFVCLFVWIFKKIMISQPVHFSMPFLYIGKTKRFCFPLVYSIIFLQILRKLTWAWSLGSWSPLRSSWLLL